MRILLICLLLLRSSVAFSQDSISVTKETNDLNRYTIFIKGEFHERNTENERSLLLLTQYLYRHNNVRYLVFEWGPDFSYLANRYLQTQNDSLLFKNTLLFTKAFWDTMAMHNRFRSAADRITIAGFDFNRSVFTARAFHEMTKGKEAFHDTAIQSSIESIIRWQDTAWTWVGQKKFVEQIKVLRSLCQSQESSLITYFGDDWPSFSAIINHDVESTPMVKRDKESIQYVKEFLTKKGEGNVLFNLGVNHAYFDGAGMGNLLQKDKHYRGKVCSIYPYHRIPDSEKEKYQQEQDQNLSTQILEELQTTAAYTLFSLSHRGIFPKVYKKAQWVYVIPNAKLP